YNRQKSSGFSSVRRGIFVETISKTEQAPTELFYSTPVSIKSSPLTGLSEAVLLRFALFGFVN
ncbi:MAG: hypothetical protein ACR2H1_07930, partial [Limisphaerales bacterium]